MTSKSWTCDKNCLLKILLDRSFADFCVKSNFDGTLNFVYVSFPKTRKKSNLRSGPRAIQTKRVGRSKTRVTRFSDFTPFGHFLEDMVLFPQTKEPKVFAYLGTIFETCQKCFFPMH